MKNVNLAKIEAKLDALAAYLSANDEDGGPYNEYSVASVFLQRVQRTDPVDGQKKAVLQAVFFPKVQVFASGNWYGASSACRIYLDSQGRINQFERYTGLTVDNMQILDGDQPVEKSSPEHVLPGETKLRRELNLVVQGKAEKSARGRNKAKKVLFWEEGAMIAQVTTNAGGQPQQPATQKVEVAGGATMKTPTDRTGERDMVESMGELQKLFTRLSEIERPYFSSLQQVQQATTALGGWDPRFANEFFLTLVEFGNSYYAGMGVEGADESAVKKEAFAKAQGLFQRSLNMQ